MNPATTAPGLAITIATAKSPRSKLFAPRGRLFFALLALWLAASALAPAQAQSGKRIAFVIGNAKYEGESTLANPHNDAALLAGVFKNELRFDEVVQHRDLNRKQMYDLVREVTRKSKGADSVVVYYSGHGMRGGGGNYLIPIDARIADEDDVRRDALAASELVDALQASNARVALLILDACRDSPYSKRTKSASKGLARMGVTSGNMLVAYATSEGNTADDGRGGNSPYAQALAQHLRNTSQPLLSQFDAVRRSVREATGNKQNPTREGDLETGVYLLASVVPERVPDRPAAPVAPLPTGPSAAEVEQQAWDAAKASSSEAGFRAYLGEYPQGRFASAARVAIASVRPAPPVQIASVVPEPRPQAAPSASQALRPGSVIKDCSDCPELVVIPAGRFMMGSNDGDASEKPIHPVNIKQFAIGKTEVTQAQWQAVMGSNPSYFKNCGSNCPVEQVSWNDVQQFIQKLNAKTGQSYRLPSEAEWEYAARAGSQSKYSFGDSEDQLGQHAWYKSNSGNSTKPVAGKQANAFGLHDMYGNVWEWVEDCWHDNYSGAPTDGSAWTTSCTENRRVLRGGSWLYYPADLRSANRDWGTPDVRGGNSGFRLARTLVIP